MLVPIKLNCFDPLRCKRILCKLGDTNYYKHIGFMGIQQILT